MNLTVYRIFKTENVIEGCLYIDEKPVCDTAEFRPLALPLGRYPVTVQHNETLELNCPWVYDRCMVPGNGVFGWRQSHIVVGERCGMGLLLHSRSTFFYLYERVRTVLRRGGKVWLSIENEWERVSGPLEMEGDGLLDVEREMLLIEERKKLLGARLRRFDPTCME